MNFSWEFIGDTVIYVVKAIPMTLFLTFFPVIVGLVIGFLLALVKINKIPVLSQIISVLSSFFRSVPLLVLLFLVYYGLPKLLNFTVYGGERILGSKNINNNMVAIITLTIYASAFLSEIIRGALSSVDKGQYEAAHALGFTKLQTYLRIIIPQAIVVALPNYFNFVLALLKGSSVVFTISVVDMMSAAKLQAEDGYRFIEAYALVGTFYIIFSIIFSTLFLKVEQRAKRRIGKIA